MWNPYKIGMVYHNGEWVPVVIIPDENEWKYVIINQRHRKHLKPRIPDNDNKRNKQDPREHS